MKKTAFAVRKVLIEKPKILLQFLKLDNTCIIHKIHYYIFLSRFLSQVKITVRTVKIKILKTINNVKICIQLSFIVKKY